LNTNWLALLLAFCGFACLPASIHPAGRLMAASVALLCITFSGRRLLSLLALLLGLCAAQRVQVPSLQPTDPSQEVVVAAQLTSPVRDGRATAWLRGAAGPVCRARLRGLDNQLERGARLHLRGRLQDLRRRPTPDRRDSGRTALARRLSAGFVVREVVAELESGSASALDHWRRSWSAHLEERAGAGAGLWRALVLADRAGLDERAVQRVRDLGMAHLLALSGMHTSILAGALIWPLRRRGRRALVFALPALLAWVLLAGGGASLVRATSMVGWWVFARFTGRNCDVRDALAATALVEITLRPQLLCGVGWWLSYAATLAVLQACTRVGSWPRPIAAIAISLAAQAATLPWILDAFGFVNLLAPAALLLVAPVFAVALVAGLGALALGAMFAVLQPWCDVLMALAGHAFGASLALASLPGRQAFTHPGLDGGSWSVALLVCALGLWPARLRVRWRIIAMASLLVAVHVQGSSDHEWVMFDVGQGDALVLRCRDQYLVVDTGPRWDEAAPVQWTLLDYLQRRRVKRLRVVITHGHLDHSGGLAALLANGVVDEVLVAAADSTRPWVARIRATQVPLRYLSAGDSVEFGHCQADVHWPPARAQQHSTNDRSLLLSVATAHGTFLMTGDLERLPEQILLQGTDPLPRARWLKVAHHGGNTGTTNEWLEQLEPGAALISCGAGNRYGHPAPILLERLGQRSIPVQRTDLVGYIRLRWSTNGGVAQLDNGLSP